ncbi:MULTISPECIES: HAMP domain-containing sensor histidine kinase [Asticcacaulis]|uniref:sensor histidine kinase n=1 Tax=Asticcacaulis TaxID=76890 RepID=UPI001AE9482E|nr:MULTISPECIES: HAMP domain-containing sensor histidine kinase [Asticcacaulis]MBP2160425.1 signal transduction histidine kinase [Asticcacaulis solisilvae]MDR6801470.1 signal transduction histidine kinase [Asticcacaulis sp. BE141]
MKRFFPKTVLGMATAISVLLSLVALAICFGIYTVTHEAVEAQLDQRIATESEILTAIYHNGGVPAIAAEIGQREAQSRVTGMGYILDDRQGNRLAGTLRARAPEPGWLEFLYDDEGNGKRGVSQALTRRLNDGLILVVAADRSPVDEMDAQLFGLFGGVFCAMLVMGVGGALGLGFLIRRRLGKIDATAQAIIDGDLSRRMVRDGTDSEFDRLSETLNRMLDRNAELVGNLQQVSNDIAHDLRTPLARLQQVLDEALSEARDVEAFRQALTKASDRSREILDLFNALLRISEIETLKVREHFIHIDLCPIVERVADAFRPDLEAGGYRLETELAVGAIIDGDRHLISQLLVNLVENVMRHTPSGTRLSLSLCHRDGQVELRVADSGPGIDPSEREHVVKRFARLEKSRSTPGFGLGLSLVSAIAQAHYATMELTDTAPGLRIGFRFPLVAGSIS